MRTGDAEENAPFLFRFSLYLTFLGVRKRGKKKEEKREKDTGNKSPFVFVLVICRSLNVFLFSWTGASFSFIISPTKNEVEREKKERDG